MKKIILAIAALALIASPALAVDWNFYGSSRMVTWYVSDDLGDFSTAAGDNDDTEFRWGSNGQQNSRFGAKVKGENVSGAVEIQMRGDSGGDPFGTQTVESRILYGQWDFGAGKLLVGKAYTPISQFISGQAFDEDLGLVTIGAMYGNRIPGFQLSFGGLTVAILQPNTNQVANAAGVATTGDVDDSLPKLEAKYGMSFDMFNFAVRGGYQHYQIEGPVGILTDDVDVDSWILGADAGVNFGPAYVKGAISIGQNTADAAWSSFYNGNGGATLNAVGDDVDDTDMFMFALVGGFKFTDQVSFEVGGGWRQNDPDIAGAKEDEAWVVYAQAPISLAPGVWVIPEIGYFDYEKNAADQNEGSTMYAGAKWQIDF
jgi:hypothetical protein